MGRIKKKKLRRFKSQQESITSVSQDLESFLSKELHVFKITNFPKYYGQLKTIVMMGSFIGRNIGKDLSKTNLDG